MENEGNGNLAQTQQAATTAANTQATQAQTATTPTTQQTQASTAPAANAAQTPATQATQAQKPEGPKGSPDENKKAQRLESENKQLKEALKTVVPIIKELGIEADEAKEKPADVDSLKAQHETEKKGWAVEKALLSSGCVDSVAALSHIDLAKIELKGNAVEGLDIESVKKDYPYLFAQPQTVSTGATPSGGTATGVAGSIADGVAAALKKG